MSAAVFEACEWLEVAPNERSRLSSTVAALSRPAAYADGVCEVEPIQTHMSWVFLTERHAYKLKKPLRGARLDWSTVEQRRRACELELVLNHRLAPDVYLGVVPLTAQPEGDRVGGSGLPIDWLVMMRRLPRAHMLDALIEQGAVERTDVQRLVAMLVDFYRRAESTPEPGPAYRRRLAAANAEKGANLRQSKYGLVAEEVRAVEELQERWFERHGPLLEARAQRVVDAHGDLRPEHVCLERSPVVIDCLDFDRELRLLDPLCELSFLALECKRLGDPALGEALLSDYAAKSGDVYAAPLVAFYQRLHALQRAALAIWHLDAATVERPAHWRQRASDYLRLALGG